MKTNFLENTLEQILNILKIHTRKLDNLERYAELNYKERELLEDMQTSAVASKEQDNLRHQHLDNVIKDVKQEVQLQGVKVEEKLDEAKEQVEKTTDKIDDISDVLTK